MTTLSNLSKFPSDTDQNRKTGRPKRTKKALKINNALQNHTLTRFKAIPSSLLKGVMMIVTWFVYVRNETIRANIIF